MIEQNINVGPHISDLVQCVSDYILTDDIDITNRYSGILYVRRKTKGPFDHKVRGCHILFYDDCIIMSESDAEEHCYVYETSPVIYYNSPNMLENIKMNIFNMIMLQKT